MLYKCRHYLDAAQLRTLYFAIFNCHLIYGCQIWGQKRDDYTEKIFTVQNKAMCALTFTEPRTSELPLYKKLKILNLSDFIKVQNCAFVWSILNRTSPKCFHLYFKNVNDQHSYRTGQNVNRALFVLIRNTDRYGTYSFKNICIKNWNQMAAIFGPALVWISATRLKHYLTCYFLKSYAA